MGRREKDRKLRRRKQRKRKLRKLNLKLSEAKTDAERQKIIEKIRRISLSNQYIPNFGS
jgi:hypothetical protein